MGYDGHCPNFKNGLPNAGMSGRDKIRAAKNRNANARGRSRLAESANAELALAAANNDDFITIAKHRLLRRKSIKVELPPEVVKTIYEKTKEKLEHVEIKSAEEIERERKEKERAAEARRRKLELEELERQRLKREEMERLKKEEEERLRRIREEEERLKREEEERQRIEREAAERRAELERKRQEAEEEAKRRRREDYQRKLAAVMEATNQKDRENAMKEVGKLTVLDFNSQEEWESHQREVGRLNILEIAGNFKKKGRKFRKDRRKTQSINWSNAKAMIHKFSDVQTQEEVVRFVKPTAVDLADLECYTGDDYPSPNPTDRSSEAGTPDSGICRSTCSQDLDQER
ncbi:hypothetical protein ACHWQZ_G006899 [Mnemiopsis leidyi]